MDFTKIALLAYGCGRFENPRLEFGPRWIRHHSQLFQPEDIYVVGNYVDKSIYSSINLINRDHPEGNEYDVFWEMATTYEAITALRLRYSVILFTSLDEFICTRRPIADVVRNERSRFAFRIPTYDVVHDPFTEPPIDLARPTLEQRKFWKYSASHTHPAILCSGHAPALGWHSLSGIEPGDIPFPDERNIFLAHFKRDDYNMVHERTLERSRWQWGLAKNQPGLSHHNKLLGKDLEEWFFQDLNEGIERTRTGWLPLP